jgi:hypothetical protein
VSKAYQQLVKIADLAGHLPATASTATPVEDVGEYSSNVVQTNILLGVNGDSTTVSQTAASVKSSIAAFTNINFTVGTDSDGVVLNITGPG